MAIGPCTQCSARLVQIFSRSPETGTQEMEQMPENGAKSVHQSSDTLRSFAFHEDPPKGFTVVSALFDSFRLGC
jgi:hypothetical protein